MSARSSRAQGSGSQTGAAQAAAPAPAAQPQQSQQSQASGPAPTSKPEKAGAPASAPVGTAAAGQQGRGGSTAPAKARSRRSTRTALRSYAVASLLTSSLVGFGGLAVSQPEIVGAPDAGYAAALDDAVARADALPQLAQEAATSTASRQAFEGAASDLATRIPQVAADAPTGQVAQLTRAAGGLSTYASTVSRASSESADGLNAATQSYREQVQAPLQSLQSQAGQGSAAWLPVTIFGLLSVIALGTLVGGAVSLAKRTRRVFNVPVTAGIVVLAGVVTAGALTAAGVIAWPAGLAGATLLTGGIVAGVLSSTGFMQRLQEYR